MLRLSYNSLYELLRAYYIYPHKTTQLSHDILLFLFFSSCLGLAVFFFFGWCWCRALASRLVLVELSTTKWQEKNILSVSWMHYELKEFLAFLHPPTDLSVHLWKLSSKTFIEFHFKKMVWKVVSEIYLIYPRSSFENVSIGGDEWTEKSNTIKPAGVTEKNCSIMHETTHLNALIRSQCKDLEVGKWNSFRIDFPLLF